jgi:hypothetical protein
MAALSKSAGPLGPEVRILPSPPDVPIIVHQQVTRRGLSIGELSALLRRGPLGLGVRIPPPPPAERLSIGKLGTTGDRVVSQEARGFESHPFRQADIGGPGPH